MTKTTNNECVFDLNYLEHWIKTHKNPHGEIHLCKTNVEELIAVLQNVKKCYK